ncbi:MAG: TIGR03936 family radical SAM-associated protein, partial [Smithellaceae bacterium]|nr:TIGR03936 family radical SAM-associated protein [Smithellaceae bacterium]
CRKGKCLDCGACSGDIRIVTAPDAVKETSGGVTAEERERSEELRLRFKFTKEGPARFLSHLETSAALVRAIRRSGLRFFHSQGFHPHPKVSFALATPVGLESRGEYVDISVAAPHVFSPEDLIATINAALPKGLAVQSLCEIASGEGSLAERIAQMNYLIELPGDLTEKSLDLLEEKMLDFLKRREFVITKERKGKTVIRDIRPSVLELSLNREAKALSLGVSVSGGGSLRATDLMEHVLGWDEKAASLLRIIKTDTFFGGLPASAARKDASGTGLLDGQGA